MLHLQSHMNFTPRVFYFNHFSRESSDPSLSLGLSASSKPPLTSQPLFTNLWTVLASDKPPYSEHAPETDASCSSCSLGCSPYLQIWQQERGSLSSSESFLFLRIPRKCWFLTRWVLNGSFFSSSCCYYEMSSKIICRSMFCTPSPNASKLLKAGWLVGC